MEPVPETERMEEFRSSPVPTLRIQNPSSYSQMDVDSSRKPPTIRRSTDPLSPTSPSWSSPGSALPYRPRTASPLSGSHTRSKSTASLAPPSMSRTRSMPGFDGAGRIKVPPQLRPASPSGSPSRVRTPRKPVDDAFPPTSPIRTSVLEFDKTGSGRSPSPVLGSSASNSSSSLRRTSSPLRYSTHSPPGSGSLPPTPSATSPPPFRIDSISNSYNFPSNYPSSSVPSTPSSVRSRSPSISSLETIPDSPDAEEAALEAERIAQLKAAAEAAEAGDEAGDLRNKGNIDVPTRGRTLGLGSRDKRKRWSVCGAERRGDLDLETIWED